MGTSNTPSCAFLFLLFITADTATVGAGSKPHILYILIDDFGWANLGYHTKNIPAVQTPNMDKLASEGLKLERHYVYNQCSPTRCAIQSGRNPIHVSVYNGAPNVRNKKDPLGGYQGIPPNMTGISEKMAMGGYQPHYVGKWDAGIATTEQTPDGRGYLSSLNYFHHANDYWTETLHGNFQNSPCNISGRPIQIVDLWNGVKPAYGLNNSWECSQENQAEGCVYEDELFYERVDSIITAHDASKPLFLFWAPHTVHIPLEVPNAYLNKFSFVKDKYRRMYSAMVNYIDTKIGLAIDLLKTKGMYDDTLIILHADNGGPIYLNGTSGANNWPLKGGKLTNWEGGIRVNAFVSGGALPVSRRGQTEESYITAWDWYATLCHLAGVDPTDHKAAAVGLPPIDSINQWGIITGTNTTLVRNEIPAGYTINPASPHAQTLVGALIQGDYKIILYLQIDSVHTGPAWRNVSSNLDPDLHEHNCGFNPDTGCLYNIKEDPNEYHNLAKTNPALWTKMHDRVKELQKGVYSPDRGDTDPAACHAAFYKWKGFWGPWVD